MSLKSVRYRLETAVGGAMPPLLYCWLEEKLRTLFNPARRGGRKRITGQDSVGVYVEWEDGERFYLNHHLLHNRYVWPDGLGNVHRLLLDKYQDRDVKVQPCDLVLEAGGNVG